MERLVHGKVHAYGSWAREEVIFGARTEVGQVEKMLANLEQRALDMEL